MKTRYESTDIPDLPNTGEEITEQRFSVTAYSFYLSRNNIVNKKRLVVIYLYCKMLFR